jgi:hypothetical protein
MEAVYFSETIVSTNDYTQRRSLEEQDRQESTCIKLDVNGRIKPVIYN